MKTASGEFSRQIKHSSYKSSEEDNYLEIGGYLSLKVLLNNKLFLIFSEISFNFLGGFVVGTQLILFLLISLSYFTKSNYFYYYKGISVVLLVYIKILLYAFYYNLLFIVCKLFLVNLK